MVVIVLKRFEFDYNSRQRVKVNDYCEFPEFINFKRWTKEGINEAEAAQGLDRAHGGEQEINEAQRILDDEALDIEGNQSYTEIGQLEKDENYGISKIQS